MAFFKRNYQNYSDEQLMQRIQKKDAAAFDVLYHRYSQRMLSYFYRMLGFNREKSQDFLQDLFLKIVDKHHLFREGATFSTWIFTIASNMCKNEYRRMNVRKVMDYETDLNEIIPMENMRQPGIEKSIDYRQLTERIEILLADCDANQRATFILRFQEQLSIREISDILGCSEGTTKSRIFYVTRKLSKSLSEYNPQKWEL